uniref:SERTA domain-containing protein n=1 Tax=Amblyomma aureolatum TaxID=187763 RepID=A0A1E1X8P3_9ACAR
MSLCKLARFRQAPDPSLLRSVLVCNTLRALERDMRPPRGPEPALPASSPSSPHHPHSPHHHHHHSPHHHHHHLNGAGIGGGHHLPPHQPYGAATPFHNGGYGDDYDRSCPPGDNGGRLTPFLRSEPATASGPPPAPLWTEEDRLPSLNWSSVLNFGSGAPVTPPAPSVAEPVSSACGGIGEPGCGTVPAPLYTLLPAHNSPAAMVVTSSTSSVVASAASPVLQTSSCSSSSSSSSSSVASSSGGGSSSDEIFGDIDLSLYDFDLLSPLSPPHVKLAPVSAEDLMRSLAASQQQAADCVVTTTATSPSAATCQLVASSGQQVSFGYKGLMGCSAEDHVATVMS